MIPRDHILEWRAQAPWPQDSQVEQDLVISRALVAIFSNDILHDALAFRGGTALYKLHLPAARYSEDIDLVRTGTGPAKPNTRDFAVYGFKERPFSISSRWFDGCAPLYQRKQGRDLFDP